MLFRDSETAGVALVALIFPGATAGAGAGATGRAIHRYRDHKGRES
jgi:hypothetical protein